MLEQVTEDVWQLAGPPLKLPGGVRMPLAATVIRLPDRSLVLYSPCKLDDAMAAAIDALGEVAHLVAPNLYHHLYVGDAARRWPRARIHGAPGLAAKRGDLTFHKDLGAELDPALRDVLDVAVVGGAPKINEAVLFHRPSGTLLCADFVFNVTRPANLRTRMALALMGTGGRALNQSRVWRFARKDRAALRASFDHILAWPIQRVVPVHGEPATIDAITLAPRLARAYGGPVTALLGSAS